MGPNEWERHFRVLLLSIPDDGTLLAWAARVPDGALVGMGSADDVARARAATAALENVMFHALDLEEIPWRDGFFDVVVGPVPPGDALALEIERVTRRTLGAG